MAHYRMLDRVPSVVITSKRNELKVYNGNNVFLNNGDNFELRFFNPLKEKIGVKIIFNGKKRGDGLLVLNPGQDIILDRFLDEQRKMLFETYTIDGNNPSAVEAIENNGNIEFEFFKERYSRSYYNEVNVSYNFPKKSNPIYSSFSGNVGSSGPSGCQGHSGWYGTKGVKTSGNKLKCKSVNSNITLSSNISTTSNGYLSLDGGFSTNTASFYAMTPLNEMETGRVEMGESSEQILQHVNANFADTPFLVTSYKMLPVSNLNQSANEVREYCTGCGYRQRKSSWTYCPKCGTKYI